VRSAQKRDTEAFMRDPALRGNELSTIWGEAEMTFVTMAIPKTRWFYTRFLAEAID